MLCQHPNPLNPPRLAGAPWLGENKVKEKEGKVRLFTFN